jgi:methylglutaconyl-CoA hydratase
MTDALITERDDRGIATLTLNRPNKHNALNTELIDALVEYFEEFYEKPNARVVIITGAGKSFCSGADLNEMLSMSKVSEDENRQDAIRLASLMNTLYSLPVPTIARINGPAFGGGLGILACCDFAIATDNAYFAFTELRLGLLPAIIAPYIINAIGMRAAKQYFLCASRISAKQAYYAGLITHLVDQDSLDTAVMECINSLVLSGPEAINECKRFIDHLVPIDADTIQHTADLIARLRVSPEGQEGISAFVEKRRPRWQAQ